MMASSEIYHLTWNEYHSSLASSVGSLREDSSFIDVTLACDKRNYDAHKVILSACSPYFNRILKKHVHPHPIVILRDIDGDIVGSLLTFMYNGVVDIPKERLPSFITAASLLEIKGLSDSPENEADRPLQNLKKNSSHFRNSPSDLIQSSKRPRFSQNAKGHSPPSPSPSFSSKYSGGAESSGTDDALHSSSAAELAKTEIDDSKGSSSGDDITIMPVKQEPYYEPDSGLSGGNANSDMMVLPGTSGDQFHSQSSPTTPAATGHVCPYCGKTMTFSWNLKHHIESVHEEKPIEQWEECQVCGKKCKTRRNLLNHLVSSHGIYQKGPRVPAYNPHDLEMLQ